MSETLTKRTITKYAAKAVVMSVAGSAITKALLAAIPATSNYKIAEISGAVGGWVVSEKLEPHTDQLVDDFYDTVEAKKAKKNISA